MFKVRSEGRRGAMRRNDINYIAYFAVHSLAVASC
jgi:hypothetical protein